MTPSKNFTIIIWVAIIAFGSLSFVAKNKRDTVSLSKGPNGGFAVVELFTSEGCSSCPPADAAIANIQKESGDLPIYILAFHVDYWNRLGWKDQFSSAAYSERQNRYAEWLNASLYTPQAVVNGTREFVGSEEGTLRNTINNDLQKPTSAEVSLKNVKFERGKISVQYKVDGETENSSILLALVQKSAVSKVERGENRGRTLSHVQIVRNFQSINLNGQNVGQASIDLPGGLTKDSLEIISFIQRNNTGEIVAATKSSADSSLSLAKTAAQQE